ncbi:CMRF35-like molecule 1 isoform X2 [Gadus morhua]|uniref:CMRF35-like molecule 1 isoform X1 n=1 Tax=Gadus morhua TaxID=8049 RepID=UPI0011B54BC6|nr:CMRF35-like molecule 1 isoform X1 [Gadus morhua]XP_030206651.1 CMRF35-like molecule 1 isoform X2 [Gadus morhua]
MKAAVPFLFFLSGCCMTWTEDLTVKGSVGGTVRIKCTHTNARSNAKYFCKETCRDKDVLITSETRRSDRPKYSIEDKGNAFFTTIRNLQLKDTGNYRCGIDRFGFDTYVRVHLKVNDVGKSDVPAVGEAITTGFKPTARPTDSENESSRGESTSDVKSDVNAVQETTTTEFEPTGRQTDFENEGSKGRSIAGDLSYQLTYIGVALGVAVLVLALVLLIFCRIKRRRAAFASDKNQSTHECPGEPRRNSLLPASLTNPHPDSAIYCNVSGFPKPQDQPDESVSVPSSPEQPGFFYSTVSYNNDSKGVALKTDTVSVMYSTIQRTQ